MSAKKGSRFAIVDAIKEMLNIGEDAQLDSFFGKIERKLENEITKAERNIENMKFNFRNDMEELENQRQDAHSELISAYKDVPLDRIQTHSSQKEFMDEYFRNVKAKKANLTNVENSIAALESDHESDLSVQKDAIKFRKSQLDAILKGVKPL